MAVNPFIRCACELAKVDPDELLTWRAEGEDVILILRSSVKTVALSKVIAAMSPGGAEASPPPDRAVKR